MIYIGENTHLKINFAWIHFRPVSEREGMVRLRDERYTYLHNGVEKHAELDRTIESFLSAVKIEAEQGNECINY